MIKNKTNNKKHNSSFIANLLYIVLILSMILITGYLSFTYYTNSKVLEEHKYKESLVITDIIWYDENNNIVKDTSDLYALGKDNNSIYCIIPNNINIGDSISFTAEHIYFTASINDKIIFSQLNEQCIDNKFYTKSFGAQLISFPILQNYIGQKLIINYDLIYDNHSGGIYNTLIGPGKDISLSFVENKLVIFQLSYIYLIIGVILILMYVLIDKKFQNKQPPRLLYLGIIAITVGIYCMLETHLPLLFISNKRIIHIVSLFAITAIPMPFILFANSIYSFKYKNTINILSIINLLCFLINILLNINNKTDFRENIFLTHIMIIIAIIIMFYSIIRYISKYCITKYEKSIYVIYMIIGLISLTICSIIDLLRFYNGYANDAVKFLRIGFLIFIICYSISSSGKIIDAIEAMAKIEVMSKLAYEDSLTGLRNRTAYDEKLSDYKNKNINFGIVMLDVNNLKMVNDTYGHDDGDIMLTTCASMIQKVFCKTGMLCYRIGGDEFVVLVRTNQILVDCLEGIENLENEFSNYNLTSNCPYPIVIASGFSIYDHKDSININQVVNEADEKMYARKKELKKLEAVK